MLANIVNNKENFTGYLLYRNIDLSNYKATSKVGNEGQLSSLGSISGKNFYGNNNTISNAKLINGALFKDLSNNAGIDSNSKIYNLNFENITVESNSDDVGILTSKINNSTVDNVNFTDVNVKGVKNVGALAGEILESSTINNITVKQTSGNKAIKGTTNVGTVAGKVESSTLNIISNIGTVLNGGVTIPANYVEGESYVGGLFGYVTSSGDKTSKCSNLLNIGNVLATSEGTQDYIGGIAGAFSGNLENAENSGNVTGKNNVAGIAGKLTNGSITTNANYVKNLGNIKGNTYVGGIVGLISSGTISGDFSYNVINEGIVGDQDLYNNTYIGGIVGGYDKNSTNNISISHCKNASTGLIYASNYAGNIAGSIRTANISYVEANANIVYQSYSDIDSDYGYRNLRLGMDSTTKPLKDNGTFAYNKPYYINGETENLNEQYFTYFGISNLAGLMPYSDDVSIEFGGNNSMYYNNLKNYDYTLYIGLVIGEKVSTGLISNETISAGIKVTGLFDVYTTYSYDCVDRVQFGRNNATVKLTATTKVGKYEMVYNSSNRNFYAYGGTRSKIYSDIENSNVTHIVDNNGKKYSIIDGFPLPSGYSYSLLLATISNREYLGLTYTAGSKSLNATVISQVKVYAEKGAFVDFKADAFNYVFTTEDAYGRVTTIPYFTYYPENPESPTTWWL
jgi:hypothetical protein